jgi:uncharacterized protein (UPF0210 family)
MLYHHEEILETVRMIQHDLLDIRTVTLGIDLRDCTHPDPQLMAKKIKAKVTACAKRLVDVTGDLERELGIPIVNRRIATNPIADLGAAALAAGERNFFPLLAQALDEAAFESGIDFIGGFGALMEKGTSKTTQALMESLPQALSSTERVASAICLASTKAGINMDAVAKMGSIIRETAELSRGQACARLVVFANAPTDNPFMAGAFLGAGEPEQVINVGVSGPGVIRAVVESLPDEDLGGIAEAIKRAAFKITRMGELVGREVSRRLEVPFGIVDLSLAPTPSEGDSVAQILEAMGLECCGTHGTTAALALLNDAVKKGGTMASSAVGGLSGAFIPVSEDQGMIRAAKAGVLTLSKLEAMTAVCSVGLDMIAIPGDTPPETISALIADEMAIGMVNNKTTAVRVIPAIGKQTGEMISFGGLLGDAPVMPVKEKAATVFIRRGGRIPAPLRSLTN